jgi:hypothetical protein
MLNALKTVNLALAFILELAMLAAFAYWGFHTGGTTLTRIIFGIGIPILAAAIWGVFMAPNSSRRLNGGAYLGLKVLLFGLAVAALIGAGQVVAGIVLGVAFGINMLLMYVWK